MKNILEHIEHARSKPHHIRKRIAFGISAGVTVVIALVWLVGSFSLGSFAIQGSTFAASTEQPSITTEGSGTNSADSGIAGAASALPSAGVPAHIEIIDTATSTPTKNAAEQTTIPF